MKLRFLPFMIAAFFIMFVVKTFDLIKGDQQFSKLLLISDLQAETSPSEEKQHEKPKEGEAPKEEALPVSTVKPAEAVCKQQYSDVEMEVLQSLSKRRDEIEQWRKEVSVKETVLKVAEGKVEEKLAELQHLQNEVNKLLQLYNEKEDIKINSLVKIYETMKPKDAAKIFEGLEMPILLQVIDRMKQSKTAPILAQMSPLKASELTTEYANQKSLVTNYFFGC